MIRKLMGCGSLVIAALLLAACSAQGAGRGGTPGWLWVVIILVVIIVVALILWWLLGRRAKEAPAAPVEKAQVSAEPAAAVTPDDLTRLEGIGPRVQQLLQSFEIKTFAQLAATDVERLKEILQVASLQYMDPSSWPEQAKLAAAGDWEGLQKLQDDLKGGRKV